MLFHTSALLLASSPQCAAQPISTIFASEETVTSIFGSINAISVPLGLSVALHSGCISTNRNTPIHLDRVIIEAGVATAQPSVNPDVMPVGMSARDLTAAARAQMGGATSHMLDI